MDGANELMVLLMGIAEEMIRGGEQIPSATFNAVSEMLPVPCDQEEIAGLALVTLLSEHGKINVPVGDLMARLSRRSPVRPRWDIVIPALARKKLLDLIEEEKEACADEENIGTPTISASLRDLRVALLIGDAVSEDASPRQMGYMSNRLYLEDCCSYVERLYDELSQQVPAGGGPRARAITPRREGELRPSVEVEAMRRRIRRLTETAECDIPLEDIRKEYGLDERDWLILLHMLWKDAAGEGVEIRELAQYFGNGSFSRYDLKKYFRGEGNLVHQGIIQVDTNGSILRRDLELAEGFAQWLIEGKRPPNACRVEAANSDSDQPFENNDHYLDAWLQFIKKQLAAVEDGPSYVRRRVGVERRAAPLMESPEFELLQRRTAASTGEFPLERVIKEHGLDDIERVILCAALFASIRGNNVDIPDMTPLLAAGEMEGYRMRRLFRMNAPLVRKDLIVVRDYGFGSPDFSMTDQLVEEILGGPDTGPEVELLVHNSRYFDFRKPAHTLDELELPGGESMRLRSSVDSQRPEVRERLRDWGADRLSAGRTTSSLLLLFSGPPGTGKTFAAEALAGTLGRALLVTDISRILSMWVGASERAVAGMFAEYRRVCEKVEAAPVLLLNECDQFLGRRSSQADRSVDRMYNQMQNLFLENLETFPGVLVATTNLTDALDDAFSRRFDEKIFFPLPDAAIRLKLWQAHLPSGVPGAGEIDLAALAEAYAFSGGQIAVVVANAVRRAALRGDVLRMEDLVEACGNEAKGAFGGQAEVMGFRR